VHPQTLKAVIENSNSLDIKFIERATESPIGITILAFSRDPRDDSFPTWIYLARGSAAATPC